MIRHTLTISMFAMAAALGCGGRAGGTSAGTSSGTMAESGSSSGSGSGAGSGSDFGTGDTLDADIPDAFPVTCAQYTFALDPDAAAEMCAFTPADVECNSTTDCTSYVKVGCGCFSPVYGVNNKNTVKCFAPPCIGQISADGGIYTCPADTFGLYTQDCQFVADSQNVAVACVNHQCLTYAAVRGLGYGTPQDCAAAGGQCVLGGGAGICARQGPANTCNCNPGCNPGGGVCCVEFIDAGDAGN
jgi:hypothetical protein